MSTQDLIIYYANLLILQYIGKPRAYATIQALVQPAIMDQLPIAVQNAFDIDTAVGVQLDVLGKYVGISRNAYDFSGPVTLNDADYRQMIKIKIIQNNSGSSLSQIQAFLAAFFPGVINVYDYQDMSLDYVLQSGIGSQQLAEVFIKSGLLPRPMGVGLRATVYSPTTDNPFGFRTYGGPAIASSPFNTYDDYELDRPWLTFADLLI